MTSVVRRTDFLNFWQLDPSAKALGHFVSVRFAAGRNLLLQQSAVKDGSSHRL